MISIYKNMILNQKPNLPDLSNQLFICKNKVL
jgi:hypothetical protein